ncbi:uncharacterized protein LOC144737603 isoform X2 [Lampetra planeri]
MSRRADARSRDGDTAGGEEVEEKPASSLPVEPFVVKREDNDDDEDNEEEAGIETWLPVKVEREDGDDPFGRLPDLKENVQLDGADIRGEEEEDDCQPGGGDDGGGGGGGRGSAVRSGEPRVQRRGWAAAASRSDVAEIEVELGDDIDDLRRLPHWVSPVVLTGCGLERGVERLAITPALPVVL